MLATGFCHTNIPTVLFEERGGAHNNICGGGLAWQDPPKYFPHKFPLPSGVYNL